MAKSKHIVVETWAKMLSKYEEKGITKRMKKFILKKVTSSGIRKKTFLAYYNNTYGKGRNLEE